MNLILWRHADAEDGAPDLGRRLTGKGRSQARRMAEWLKPRLPKGCRIVVSPAVRARETADALGVDYDVVAELAPGADSASVLGAVGWPELGRGVLAVGHQPTLGRVASLLICGDEAEMSLKKGAIVWIARRGREGGEENVIRAALSPDLLDAR